MSKPDPLRPIPHRHTEQAFGERSMEGLSSLLVGRGNTQYALEKLLVHWLHVCCLLKCLCGAHAAGEIERHAPPPTTRPFGASGFGKGRVVFHYRLISTIKFPKTQIAMKNWGLMLGSAWSSAF